MFARVLMVLGVTAAFLYLSLYRVYEQERGILFQVGEIRRTIDDPGLYFKIPVYQNVKKFDIRLQTLDAEPQRFLTGEKKDVIVDSFVQWRISDLEQYYKSTGGDVRRAGLLLYQKINNGLRNEFGKRTVQEVVSGARGTIMDTVTEKAEELGKELGMTIVDVRLKRIDLPAEVSSTVYERMRSERARVAREFRARGDSEAIRIRADADRQRTIISAEAYRDGQSLRGAGDAQATETYGNAFGRNVEFYDFTRSLEAYRRSFRGRKDVLVLDPASDFFKYFSAPGSE